MSRSKRRSENYTVCLRSYSLRAEIFSFDLMYRCRKTINQSFVRTKVIHSGVTRPSSYEPKLTSWFKLHTFRGFLVKQKSLHRNLMIMILSLSYSFRLLMVGNTENNTVNYQRHHPCPHQPNSTSHATSILNSVPSPRLIPSFSPHYLISSNTMIYHIHRNLPIPL